MTERFLREKSGVSGRTMTVVLALVLTLLATTPAPAGQSVQATAPVTKDVSVAQAQAKARQEALAKAVFAEALTLLPGALPQARQDALRLWLTPQAPNFVQNYSETGFTVEDGQATLGLDVNVKRQTLKSALQRMGVYYTVGNVQSYVLTQQGLVQADLDTLRQLQTVSGLRTTYDAGPRLHIERLPQSYTARLEISGKTWAETAPGLDQLWPRIWGDYFTYSGVKSTLTDSFYIEFSGPGGPDTVRNIGTVLARLDRLVDSLKLAWVDLTAKEFKARFTCRVVSRETLTKELNTALAGQSIAFSFVDK